MRTFPAGVAALLVITTCALAQESPDQRARFEASLKMQSDFEHRLFVDAGFQPISEVAAAGRDLRRVLFRDPYGILPVPGVEIERFADGRVTLRVFSSGTVIAPVAIAASAWTDLVRHDAAVFARRPYIPWTDRKPGDPMPPPPPIHHGWLLRFESSDLRSASGGDYVGPGAGQDYAAAVAGLAVGTRPDCTFDPKSPCWSFSKCFTPVWPNNPSR